ncbi:hypothetical protein GCM10023321_04600 [Pseudonocardia eucalypti]|uniref:Uncharacterized protein n=1 Tax=Pseudonocardia eucalypti TaxID=648755 RepID=A0ABP9PFU7_9PSEU
MPCQQRGYLGAQAGTDRDRVEDPVHGGSPTGGGLRGVRRVYAGPQLGRDNADRIEQRRDLGPGLPTPRRGTDLLRNQAPEHGGGERPTNSRHESTQQRRSRNGQDRGMGPMAPSDHVRRRV